MLQTFLGTVTDVKRVAEMVHAVGGILVVDGAQAAPHQRWMSAFRL